MAMIPHEETSAQLMVMSITPTDVDIRHLRVLRAVSEEGTFARTADRLGCTQLAISRAVITYQSATVRIVPDGVRPPRRERSEVEVEVEVEL